MAATYNHRVRRISASEVQAYRPLCSHPKCCLQATHEALFSSPEGNAFYLYCQDHCREYMITKGYCQSCVEDLAGDRSTIGPCTLAMIPEPAAALAEKSEAGAPKKSAQNDTSILDKDTPYGAIADALAEIKKLGPLEWHFDPVYSAIGASMAFMRRFIELVQAGAEKDTFERLAFQASRILRSMTERGQLPRTKVRGL